MPGRNAKPIEQHILEGNPNRLTKEEIERRKKAKIKLGSDKFTVPPFVKEDPIAYKKWKILIKEYKAANELGVFLLSSTDISVLARYCKTYSEYRKLVARRERIDDIEIDIGDAFDYLTEKTSEDEAKALMKKLNYVISSEGVMKLDTAINKKQDMLIKMEDRLFLNPLSKIKNIVKTVPDEKGEDPIGSKFGAL